MEIKARALDRRAAQSAEYRRHVSALVASHDVRLFGQGAGQCAALPCDRIRFRVNLGTLITAVLRRPWSN